MNKKILFPVLCVVILVLGGCASNPKVSRVDASTVVDLSGYWNDTDVRIVCDSLIKDCLDSPRMNMALAQMGRTPIFLVGPFRNETDEHSVKPEIIANIMERAIFNSGRADFVDGGVSREALRAERLDQQGNASEATAKALGNETGADFLLTGSVNTMVDRAGNTTVRVYFVEARLVDLETNRLLWTGENSEIKKVIKQPNSKL
jgi:PBP1b-binding outer membrane lipoprotein LpoB